MSADRSIVRENLLERLGYTPYCGAYDCLYRWPRTQFDGEQFACACGWRSQFEAAFIEQYKSFRESATANDPVSARNES